jgi:uncharacterized protein (DUF885 family)
MIKQPLLRFAALCAIASFTLAHPAQAAPSEDLNRLINEHWEWSMAQNPVLASELGVSDDDTKLNDVSLANADRQAATAKQFLERLVAIPQADLSQAERTNKGILIRMLSAQVEANKFGQRMMLFSTYDSWHQGFVGLPLRLQFETRDDYASYLARLTAYPKLNVEAIAISRQAIAKGYVQPCEALGGFEKTISGAVDGDPKATAFFEPFTRKRPVSISAAEWTEMQSRAVTIITGTLKPEYQNFLNFYVREYKPKCAKQAGISFQKGGAAYYAFQAREHTTTDLTPDEIHKIGLNEVARIRGRMEQLAKTAGYASREAMILKLRTNPKYFATSPEALMTAAAATAKLIDGKMPNYFNTLPRLPYGIKAIPAETAEITTTAYYNSGKPESGIAGFYYVNTSKLPQRPLWELPALTAHEAVPGHHHQISLQQELQLPYFRKYLTGFTAFVEGWGLYAEYLGEEMGLYDTPEKMMGRLSYEMWRAGRLVVDTGIHAKGWTKAQAIAFMKDNTALTDANIEAEVNRYISWPGQALGYKIGEIKIRELRARAEAALGTKFNLRRFHDAVLKQGAVPLTVLEQQIDDWIAQEQGR